MIWRHLPNTRSYFEHCITNAVSDGVNNAISTIQKRTYGYRNRSHFKTAVLFRCGGLNLYSSHAVPG